MFSSRRRTVCASLAAAAAAPGAVWAQQQFSPDRPVRFVVPFPPGGGADQVARQLSEELRGRLGRPMIIENKPGAGGLLGLQEIGKSAPDGHTIGHFISGHTTLQTLFKRTTLLDLIAPVCRLSFYNLGIFVAEDSRYQSLQSLLDAIRANPGRVTMGISGIGNPGHIAWELMRARLGDAYLVNAVPMKGSPEVLLAMRGGQLDFSIAILGVFGAYLQKGGGVRALAVTGGERAKLFPDIPTAAQAGLAGFSYMAWDGIAAPAGTPPGIVSAWYELINAGMQTAGYRSVAERLAMTPAPSPSTEEFGRFVRTELQREEALVREGKLKLS
ncbi:MAG: tripartite tricarboxylate transporter substrate binding protein [Burkholderiaceae bacterium]